jgi:hypothetical protein
MLKNDNQFENICLIVKEKMSFDYNHNGENGTKYVSFFHSFCITP